MELRTNARGHPTLPRLPIAKYTVAGAAVAIEPMMRTH
jgi:hypothetical protein